MTEEKLGETVVGAKADPSALVPLSESAAQNIVAATGLAPAHAKVIENAIKDEISAVGTHFTLLYAEMSDMHEAVQQKLKADYDAALKEFASLDAFVKVNKLAFFTVVFVAVMIGVALGKLV